MPKKTDADLSIQLQSCIKVADLRGRYMLQSRKGQQEEVQVRVGLHPSGDLLVFSHDILQKIANN